MQPIDRSIRTVTWNFLVLGFGELLARALSFIAIIYIARILGPENYGVVGFAAAIILYFTRITDFGIEALGPHEVAKNRTAISKAAPSILIVRVCIAIVLIVILNLVGLYLMDQPEGAVLGIISLSLLAAGASSRWIHLGMEKVGYISIGRTIGEITRLILIVGFVNHTSHILCVPLAHVVAEFVTTLLMLWWLRKHPLKFDRGFSWAAAKPFFSRSWPMMVTPIMGLAIYNSDLVIMRFFLKIEDIGFYLAAYTLITFLGNVGASYSNSLLPTLTRAADEQKHQRDLYHTGIAHVFAVGLPIAAGGYLLAEPLVDLGFGSDYQASVPILEILIWSVPLLLIRSILQTVLISTGRQLFILRLTALSAVLNFALNLLVIPHYGMVGAALTTVVTELVRMLLSQHFANRVGFLTTGMDRYWRSLFATTSMVAILLIIEDTPLWIGLSIGVVTYVVTLTIIGGIRFQRGHLPSLSV